MKTRFLSLRALLFYFALVCGLHSPVMAQVDSVLVNYTAPFPHIVDGCGDYCFTLPAQNVTNALIPPGNVIKRIQVLVTFGQFDMSIPCSDHSEISMRLDGPTCDVILASPGTWTTCTPLGLSAVIFDQAAAAPASGTPPPPVGSFQPNGGNLDVLMGTDPHGSWALTVGDNAAGGPLRVFSYILNIVYEPGIPAPCTLPITDATVSGTVYVDANNNCMADPGEAGIGNRWIRAVDGSGNAYYGYSDASGNYEIGVPPGSYSVRLIENEYTDDGGCNLVYNETLMDGDNETGRDFFISPICFTTARLTSTPPPGQSICAPNPQRTPCPGASWSYCVNYQNLGTETINNGFINQFIDLDPNMSYTQTPPSINSCGLSVIYFPGGDFAQISAPVSPNLNPGDICKVCLEVNVNAFPPGGQFNTAYIAVDNCGLQSPALTEQALCSCDPNDLSVSPIGCGDQGLIGREVERLMYTINFQNLGTGPATDVRIEAALSGDLDLGSILFPAMSHSATNIEISPANILTIEFEGINLPSESMDPEGSQGQVVVEVNIPAGLPDGTVITNEASIIFDDNVPVVTNSVINTIATDPSPVVNLGPDVEVVVGYAPQACAVLDPAVSGGLPPYIYDWSTGETTSTISVCPEVDTEYHVYVSDAGGACVGFGSIRVAANDIRCEKSSKGSKSSKSPKSSKSSSKSGKSSKSKSGSKSSKTYITLCKDTGSSGGPRTKCVSAKQAEKLLAKSGWGLGPCPETTEKKARVSLASVEGDLNVYPNPLKGNATVSFNSPESGAGTVSIYSILGNKVADLFEGSVEAGQQIERDFSTTGVAPGVYMVRFNYGTGVLLKKVVIMD